MEEERCDHILGGADAQDKEIVQILPVTDVANPRRCFGSLLDLVPGKERVVFVQGVGRGTLEERGWVRAAGRSQVLPGEKGAQTPDQRPVGGVGCGAEENPTSWFSAAGDAQEELNTFNARGSDGLLKHGGCILTWP